MKIQYKWFDGRYTQQGEAKVKKIAEYKGHDIFRGSEKYDKWYYVKFGDEWLYFPYLKWAQKSIEAYIQNIKR